MKLSIITCTYNSEKYLQECIDSVIAQNLNIDIYEHIFVDACSTDKTKKIIEKYKKEYPNVKLLERKPKWVYNAMNEWIKEAKWEYIICLNSDDWLAWSVLKKYLKYVENTWNLDVYYWKVSYTKDKVHYYTNLNSLLWLRKFLFKHFGWNVLIWHPATLMKKEIFEGDIWFFDETKKIASDYWLLLKCLCYKKTFCYFDEIVTNFRIHEWSLSTNWKNSKQAHKETRYFKKKYLPLRKAYISNIIDYWAEFYWKIIS